jgi:mannosyltransferase
VRLLVLACLLVIWRAWISPLPSSFWIDETGTVWAIRGNIHEVISRLQNHLFPQMPVFVLLMWGWSQIAGLSESALRIPLVVASIGSTFTIYALGKRLLGQRAGLYAAVVLMTLSHFDFAAADARAYALAVFCLIATLFWRVRLQEAGRSFHAVLYGLGCGLCVNLIYFFAVALVADVLYLGIAWKKGWIHPRKRLILAWLIAFLMFLPLVPTLRIITHQSDIHIVAAGVPSWTDLGVSLLPPRWIVAALPASICVGLLYRRRLAMCLSGTKPTLAMILSWATVPQLLLFIYSLVSHHSVYLPRYLLGSSPGIALIGGYLLSCLEPVVWRASIAGILAAITIVGQGWTLWTNHYIEDWRSGSEVITRIRKQQPATQLLVVSSYVESAHLPMPAEPGADYDFMLSPLRTYLVPGESPILLPVEMTDRNVGYVRSVMEHASREDHFLMLVPTASPLLPWVLGYLDAHFEVRRLHANPVVLEVFRNRIS